MGLVTRWDEFKTVGRFDVVDARCCTCRGVFTGAKLYLSQVLQENGGKGDVILCNSCKASHNLQTRHTDAPSRFDLSRLLRSILADQGKCAITGEPLTWGYNCSPDHIEAIGGSLTKKKSPWDPGNLQVVSIAANQLKGDLTMAQTDHLLSALRGKCDLQNPRIRFSQGGISQSAHLAGNARLSSKRRSAKGRSGMIVEIDTQWVRDQWRLNPFCHWSGLPFPGEDLQGYTYTVSLDRLNDHVGYTRENTVLCLSPFNRMRSNGSAHTINSGMTPGKTQDYIYTLKAPEPIRSARFRMLQEKYPRFKVSFPDDLPF